MRWSAIWANPETRQTRPPTTATFPRHTADKSPPQQHDVSILRLIGHVVLLGFVPCMPWYALLVRTWACYSEPGQPRPRTEQTAHVRNSGFTCGTRWNPGRCRTQPIHDGSWGSHTQTRDAAFTGTRQTRPPTTATFPRNTTDKSPPQQHDVSILRLIGHVVLLGFVPCMPWYALLVRTWACYSEPGQPRPRTEQTAHVRNSGFTCGTRWNPGHCRTQPIHNGSWGSHTQARDAAFTGTRQTPPPTTATFPRNKAKKSPC